jgi:hypothetical protein|tara:strand:+ start:163 stop:588 length:426 start_codon:yes stop_codon:yes gene_type:complete
VTQSKQCDLWWELCFIFGGATRREKNVDLEKDKDWDGFEQYTLGGAVSVGCALMEEAGLKGEKNEHIKLIFELRNAFVHNGFDLTKNRDKKAFSMASEYLSDNQHLHLNGEISGPYFSLNGNKVVFNSGILHAITLILNNN